MRRTDTEPPVADLVFEDGDGYDIWVRVWIPRAPVAGVVVFAHGGGEHGGRYLHLAEAFAAAGYAVAIPDHRGHGRSAPDPDHLGQFGPEGWDGMVTGFDTVCRIMAQRHPHARVFVAGHSMGSIIVQDFIQRRGRDVDGAILLGSFGEMGDLEQALKSVDEEIARSGATAPSTTFSGLLQDLNAPFDPPARPATSGSPGTQSSGAPTWTTR